MPNPKDKPDTLTLAVERSAFGGEGIAFAGGKVAFVEGALPGETVEAVLLAEKGNFTRFKTVRVLTPSPHRIEPPCRYYSECGGCQYQHVSYEEELRLKQAQLGEVLEKIGGVRPEIDPIVRAPNEYGYRRSVTLHVQEGKKAGRYAFIGRDNASHVPISSCLLLHESLAPVFSSPIPRGAGKISFKAGESGIVSDLKPQFFRADFSGRSFLAASQGFIQSHFEVFERMLEIVRRKVAEKSPRVFFDLFAGFGLFGFASTEPPVKIVFAEENAASVEALRMNAAERKNRQCTIIQDRAERAFPSLWEKEGGPESLILLDPPRQGLKPELAGFLADLPASILYISCDPATLARDLKLILRPGHFKLSKVIPFDLFPRTAHLETISMLEPI